MRRKKLNLKEILQKIHSYYRTLFMKQLSKSGIKSKLLLDNATTPILSNKKISFCKKDLSEDDLYKAMKSMSNTESPENDGLRNFKNHFGMVLRNHT